MILNKSQIMEKKPSAGGSGYKYYRLWTANSLKTHTYYSTTLQDWELWTGFDQTGTEYPTTSLTSATSETGITISSGKDFNTSYANWKTFDSNTSSTGWWNLGATAAQSWLQIAFDTAKDIKSMKFVAGSQWPTGSNGILLYGSNTGAFTGEEVELGFIQGARGSTTFTWNINDGTYPTTPSGLSSSGRTTSSISFAWTASTDDGSISNYEYRLNGGSWVSTGSTVVNKTVSSLSENTTYNVEVRAKDNDGKYSNSSNVLAHYTTYGGHTYTQSSGSGSYSYYRLHACTSSGTHTANDAGVRDIEFHTSTNGGGTEYPTTHLTSATSESGITISSGTQYSTTYANWKAFDSSTSGTMWWTLGGATTSSNNWIQLYRSSGAFTCRSIEITTNADFNDCAGFQIYGSNTGAFSGEETTIGRITGLSTGNRQILALFNL